jgi:hypothetical protein
VRQFGWVYRCQSISNPLSQNRFGFGIFLETARLSASDYIIEGAAHSERRGSSWQELSSLAKQQTRKGKLYEKASLNCIGDKWIGFRSRAAF